MLYQVTYQFLIIISTFFLLQIQSTTELTPEQVQEYIKQITENSEDCSKYLLQCQPVIYYQELALYKDERKKVCQKLIQIMADTLDNTKISLNDVKILKINKNNLNQNIIQIESQLYYYPISIENYIHSFEAKLATKFNADTQINRQYFDSIVLYGTAFQMNKELCKKILFNQILPDQLLEYSRLDLMNDEQLSQRNQYEEKLQEKRDLERFIQQTGIECKFCHSLTVVVTEKQTRSADEATTVIYKCSKCQKQWSFNN